MRDMTRRFLPSLVILSMFIVIITWVPPIPVAAPGISNPKPQDKSSPTPLEQDEAIPIEETKPEGKNVYSLADAAPADGVLNPVTVEQSGYAASGNISARTDNYQNLVYDLPLDMAHNWKADLAEVSVWNLEKLYVVNGTFDDGFPGYTVNPNNTLAYYPLGWSAISYSGDPGQVQQVSYEQSSEHFVTVQNTAKLTNLGQHQYTHYAGTNITWLQTFEDVPFTNDFTLNFKYLLLQGPLSPTFSGKYSLKVFVGNAVVSSIDLPTLSARGQWYSSGSVHINIASPSQFMTFKIGLVIDSQFMVDADEDYDGDGSPDGAINTQFITVYLDDASFVKETPPTANQVNLEFTAGSDSSQLTGSLGSYYTSVSNSSYWTTTPVQVSLSANTSVSFDYKTRLYSHRFTDSNSKPTIASVGISYSINHGLSTDLWFYSYVGYLGQYEDPEMRVRYPSDWENVTVSDPFLIDRTSDCSLGTGFLIVPTTIIENVGWWEVRLQSPNYAKSIKSQILDGGWSDIDPAIFRIGNTTRSNITIGTTTETPATLTNVNITWFNPFNELWYSELRSGASGQVTSTSRTFNSSFSPAGEWWVEVYWTNGTEVAYDMARFQVRHSTTLVAEPSEITTNTGSTFKGIVRYFDNDTGAYLLDPSATVEGNWSASIVAFDAFSIRNWWEADFDTSLVGAGEFTIVVTASRQYYDVANCVIYVHSINVTRLTSPNAPWTAAKLGDLVSLTFRYQAYDSLTETWTHVKNETDVAATLNWTSGYWSVLENRALGIYSVSLDTNIIDSGTYLLNVTFSKPDHYSQTLFLTLILSPMTSSLTIVEGLSARVDLEVSKTITLEFKDKNGLPVQNASVVVDGISPSSGLSHTAVVENAGEPGSYNVTLTPYSATAFTVRFLATGKNVEPAISVFVIVVNDVSTDFEIYVGSSVEIGLLEGYNATFRYELSNGTGIEKADIEVVYSGPAGTLSYSLPSEHGFGDYSLLFNASLPGTYVITIIAFKPFHQRASGSFSLIVRNIPANLLLVVGGSNEMGLNETYEMSFRYEMYNGTGIGDASVSVVHPSGVTHEVTPGGLGNYTLQFNATLPGSYLVTISASKQYCQGESTSFLLIVREISTHLILSAGNSEEMGLTDTYEMSFRYEMYNGTGIEGATINIIHSSGIMSNLVEQGLGNYSIQFNADSSGQYLVTIDASKQYCQRISASFLLVVREISTNMISLNGTSDFVGFGKSYRLFVSYTNTSGYGLVGANVSVVDADAGIDYTPGESEAPGIYSILLTPLSSNTFSVTIQANLSNYRTQTVFFTLVATAISTTLTTLNASTSVSVDQSYTVYLRYQDEDLNNLENASLSILNPPQNLNFTMFENLGDGLYRITLSPEEISTFDVIFSASKDGYQTDYASFTLIATIVHTGLVISGLSSASITYSQQYELIVLYTRVDTELNITGASITVAPGGPGLNWTATEEATGGYRIRLVPQRAGNWTINVYAIGNKYAGNFIPFRLEAKPISMVVELVSGSAHMEASPINITVRLFEYGSNKPVDGASVSYRLSVSRTGSFKELQPTSTPGVYAVLLPGVPLYSSSHYRLEISAEKENYELRQAFDNEFTITQNFVARNSLTITASGGLGISLVVFFVALRIVSSRKKKRLSYDLINKRRFDDADNLIGAIVLHKKSGIPIYSRIPKGGFDEGIVAAFVSAVTHFREEFEMFDEEMMQVIPISDIIRAVQTRNLICAFVTVKSASMDHNRKMEAYAMQVGTYLDDLFEEQPSSLIDSKITEMLDFIFDTTMDGNLIKYYKVSTSEPFPKRYRLLERLMKDIEMKHCSKPVYLAQGVATYGVTQARGCTLVLEAIDLGLISICEEHEVDRSGIDFKQFFRSSEERANSKA
jgi:hypothetical protein